MEQDKGIFLSSLQGMPGSWADSPRWRLPGWLMAKQALISACLMGHVFQSPASRLGGVLALWTSDPCTVSWVRCSKKEAVTLRSGKCVSSRLQAAKAHAKCWGSSWSCPHVLPFFTSDVSRACIAQYTFQSLLSSGKGLIHSPEWGFLSFSFLWE